MILHLGVDDLPYAEKGSDTTGDVAEWLENKFGVMQIFADDNQAKIAAYLEDGLAGAMESVLAGAPENFDVFGSAMNKIKARFSDFIDLEESGVVTKAKQAPKSGPRKKRQYRKVDAKTTFVESGGYRNSFMAWVE